MTYWKIQFTKGHEGFGFLKFDEEMVSIGLFDEHGNVITEPVDYHPVEFNVIPEWA